MKIGYARVSTIEQNLQPQIEQLKQAGAEKIYSEKYTGTTTERPVFDEVMETLKIGDTLIVTKLDRLARNLGEALHVVDALFTRQVAIDVLNLGRIDNTPSGKLIFNVFMSFAQFERDLIVARTQEGKAYARKHDPSYRDGRPRKFTPEQLELAYKLRQQGYTYRMIEKSTGISTATQRRRFKEIEAKKKVNDDRKSN
ncbi:recombinase family protein [Lactobacillus amylovorus]|uniref:recombinase family protein n=1 Tax=Lactobacillus amylovorus TaxID=1604 RepID=UPI00232CF675|nr:recombinase family protein [Lactobacillus amylovorus]MDB6260481.1 recombinase family protein [Lactobacillus amylovorus]